MLIPGFLANGTAFRLSMLAVAQLAILNTTNRIYPVAKTGWPVHNRGMSLPFRTTRRVEFSDTDAAGIMHFSAFFRFMEQAEHDLLRSQGLSVVMQDDETKVGGGKLSWPRVHAHCDFRSPAHYEDLVEIEVSLSRLGEKSASYQFRFVLAGLELAKGEITSVCCRIVPGQPPLSVTIPDWFRAKLQPFVVSATEG